MATCENCIHKNVCNTLIKNGLPYDDEFPADKFCLCFKEKSLMIELPCKVGNTVYAFCDAFGVVLPYFVETLGISYYNENENAYLYEANCTNAEQTELLDSIDFDFDDIGKIVFLSREEAEKALKEREKNG